MIEKFSLKTTKRIARIKHQRRAKQESSSLSTCRSVCTTKTLRNSLKPSCSRFSKLIKRQCSSRQTNCLTLNLHCRMTFSHNHSLMEIALLNQDWRVLLSVAFLIQTGMLSHLTILNMPSRRPLVHLVRIKLSLMEALPIKMDKIARVGGKD